MKASIITLENGKVQVTLDGVVQVFRCNNSEDWAHVYDDDTNEQLFEGFSFTGATVSCKKGENLKSVILREVKRAIRQQQGEPQ